MTDLAAQPQLKGAPRRTLASTAADIWIIVRRNIRRVRRLPQLLVFATIQPVMFLLLFNYVFGGSIGLAIPPAADGKYINWLLPGILIQVATFGATQTAVGLTEDLKAGVVDRFRSLPMARSAVLAGRTFADLLRNIFVIGLMVAAGFIMGFRPQTGMIGLAAGFAVAMLFAYAFSWIMASIGLAVKDTETAQTAGFIWLFPLVFASSIFAPIETFPGWLQGFATYQPVSVVASAIRGLILGQGSLAEATMTAQGMVVTQEALAAAPSVSGQVVLALGWIAVILLVFPPLAIRLYRRAVN